MNFEWAVTSLKLGRKVRRAKWNEKSYIVQAGPNRILNNELCDFKPAVSTFEATDWEFFEEVFDFHKIEKAYKYHRDRNVITPNRIRLHPKAIAQLRKDCEHFNATYGVPPGDMILGMVIVRDERLDPDECTVYYEAPKRRRYCSKWSSC